MVADSESLCNQAQAWARQGRYPEAEAAYREAVLTEPDRLKAYLGLGLVLRRQRRSAEAEAVFKHAILLKPDGVSAHMELGGALFEQGRYPEAAAAYREAIRLRPDFAQAHVSLGLALARTGAYGDAEFALRRALSLNPKDATAVANLAREGRGSKHAKAMRAAGDIPGVIYSATSETKSRSWVPMSRRSIRMKWRSARAGRSTTCSCTSMPASPES